MSHGFSLWEVLVSLVLIASTSLALLKQQWHMSQMVTSLSEQARALLTKENACENARFQASKS